MKIRFFKKGIDPLKSPEGNVIVNIILTTEEEANNPTLH